MLPRAHRLPPSQFPIVKQTGKLIQFPLFGLIVYPTSLSQPSRFGIIISTKISPHANRRNRLRRLLREAIRSLLPHFHPGHDFILLAKHPLLHASLEQITQNLRKLLNDY